MDENEEIVARFMNDTNLRKLATGLLASETYRKLGGKSGGGAQYPTRPLRKKPKG